MLRSITSVFFVLVVSAQAFAAIPEYEPKEIIVKYKDQFRSRAQVNALYQSLGVARVQHNLGSIKGMDKLTLLDHGNVQQAIMQLEMDDSVAYAQPNYILYALPDPDSGLVDTPTLSGSFTFELNSNPVSDFRVPMKDRRPALKEAPGEVDPPVEDPELQKNYGLEKIQAVAAWKNFKGDRKFVVADIDTGVDYNHEDLAYNMWRNPDPSDKKDVVGFDFVHDDGLPFDDNKHGTHTSGILGAVGDNGVGASGVAQRVSIMAVKFLNGWGAGSASNAIKAISYAVEHNAKVLSNSWGGRASKDNKALQEAIAQAEKKGVLFIAAAGNSGEDNDGKRAAYPAAFDNENIIAVASTDKKDELSKFSNYGKKSTHLAAPGADIYSTIPDNKYKAFSGTSMACPFVAGAAALVWSQHPDWDYKQVKKALLDTVDPLETLKDKTVSGGRLNVAKALEYKPVEEPPKNDPPKNDPPETGTPGSEPPREGQPPETQPS